MNSTRTEMWHIVTELRRLARNRCEARKLAIPRAPECKCAVCTAMHQRNVIYYTKVLWIAFPRNRKKVDAAWKQELPLNVILSIARFAK